jgi:hypothetical protein
VEKPYDISSQHDDIEKNLRHARLENQIQSNPIQTMYVCFFPENMKFNNVVHFRETMNKAEVGNNAPHADIIQNTNVLQVVQGFFTSVMQKLENMEQKVKLLLLVVFY